MTEPPAIPPFLWQLFQQLRRRGFVLGTEDYEALQQALRAGFGWSSRQALKDLCCALWAKSQREQDVLTALFNQLAPQPQAWQYSLQSTALPVEPLTDPLPPEPVADIAEPVPQTAAHQGLPPIPLSEVEGAERSFVLVPQFPLTYREVAQAWRRLRRPIRMGAPIELDLEATIARRSRLGVASAVVLQPRRRNVARLLLLVDRQGSMDPFHRFCDEVCAAIQQAGRLEDTALYYFHNVPVEGADDRVLLPLKGQLFPVLDPVLSQIPPLEAGSLYPDAALLTPQPAAAILQKYAAGASVAIISDAGAARNRYRVSRLLDTIAFLKALRRYTAHTVWLNPLPPSYWGSSTAAQIARHVPMFPLDRRGLDRAVNVLRGQQHIIEKPLSLLQ